jgi:hypothetical protein
MKKARPPWRGPGESRANLLLYLVVYARVSDMRATPDRTPEEGRQRVHMQTCVARIAIIGLASELGENEIRPDDGSAGRVTLFSTLFNVAAIGGKSPRTFDCARIVRYARLGVK